MPTCGPEIAEVTCDTAMNQDSSTTWHQTLQDDPMLVAGDDEFSTFLQFGIDFPGFDEAQAHHNGFDTPMGDLGMDQLAMDSSLGDIRSHTLHTAASFPERGRGHLIHAYTKIPTSTDSVINGQVAQPLQVQQQRKRDAEKSQYEHRIMIPPTPQSSEMQGAAARYYHYMEGDGMAEFEPYRRQRDDQVSVQALEAMEGLTEEDDIYAPGVSSCHTDRSKFTFPRIDIAKGVL